MTIIAIVAMLAVLFVPIASEESSAEITADGITVVVPGHKVTESTSGDTINLVINDLTVNNNKTKSINVYITNGSSNALNIYATGSSGNDLSVSASSDKNLIFPGDISDKTICTVTINITASEYANTHVGGNFVLHYGCIRCQNSYAGLIYFVTHLLAGAEAVLSANLLVLA